MPGYMAGCNGFGNLLKRNTVEETLTSALRVLRNDPTILHVITGSHEGGRVTLYIKEVH